MMNTTAVCMSWTKVSAATTVSPKISSRVGKLQLVLPIVECCFRSGC
jgi:hypothetical protein